MSWPVPTPVQSLEGQLVPGNINLHTRPVVHNLDGSISTVRSITVGLDHGRFVLIPTVVGHRVVSNDDAIRHFQQTGQHLGIFSSEKQADVYAQNLHEAQAAEYLPTVATKKNQPNPQALAKALRARSH